MRALSPAETVYSVKRFMGRSLADVKEAAGLPYQFTDGPGMVGISTVNLSVMKNDRAKAVRFSTLTALCDALDCTPGDLFTVEPS